ncbi:ABC transporter permease [Sandaracinus amylolyticus]|nr:ABC transporter permease [Sandaracinus amylolyticus]
MIRSSATRYALRSLRRNPRRTLISIVGLAFGVGVGLVALSWVGGQEAMSVDAIAGGGLGHLRIAPRGWNERRDDALRLSGDDDLLARVRATEGVAIATPRARTSGLLGLGTRSTHVSLTGVDPETEPRALRYVQRVAEGRYLAPGEEGAIVLGRAIAHRLRAQLEDELVVTVVDDEGEMQSALLVVVGIVDTGSRPIDQSIAHVALSDVERLSGREGFAEITILLDDLATLETTRAAIPTPEGSEVLSWLEISPEFRARLQSGRAFTNVAVAIVLIVVLLGVASAQLTSVLERRKELAVLAAIGMRGRSLVRVVVTEGLILGALGALLALAWSSPILHRWATAGVDLSSMMPSRDGLAFGGVLIDPIYHPAFGAWLVPTALSLSLIATIVASLYPAWFASRTDPASALRVDR